MIGAIGGTAELGDRIPSRSLAVADLARGKRVMVIDDDVLSSTECAGILQSWGCRVQTAASGKAALASVGQDGGATGSDHLRLSSRRW